MSAPGIARSNVNIVWAMGNCGCGWRALTCLCKPAVTHTLSPCPECALRQMRTWLGGEATERIEEWRTVVYEAAGVVKAVSITKARPCPTPAAR